MADFIVLPIGPGDFIALSTEQIEEARARARDMLPSPASTSAPEPLLTADVLAKLLDVPVSQIEALGRQARIPSVPVGKYRRYKYTEVLAALREAH